MSTSWLVSRMNPSIRSKLRRLSENEYPDSHSDNSDDSDSLFGELNSWISPEEYFSDWDVHLDHRALVGTNLEYKISRSIQQNEITSENSDHASSGEASPTTSSAASTPLSSLSSSLVDIRHMNGVKKGISKKIFVPTSAFAACAVEKYTAKAFTRVAHSMETQGRATARVQSETTRTEVDDMRQWTV